MLDDRIDRSDDNDGNGDMKDGHYRLPASVAVGRHQYSDSRQAEYENDEVGKVHLCRRLFIAVGVYATEEIRNDAVD